MATGKPLLKHTLKKSHTVLAASNVVGGTIENRELNTFKEYILRGTVIATCMYLFHTKVNGKLSNIVINIDSGIFT